MAPRKESAERETEDKRTHTRHWRAVRSLDEALFVAGNGGEMMGLLASARSTKGRTRRRVPGSFRVGGKPGLGFLQRKGILVVGDAGTHPCALDRIHDVETAVPLSVSRLLQTKTIALSDATDAFLVCVAHGAALSSRSTRLAHRRRDHARHGSHSIEIDLISPGERPPACSDHLLDYFDAESFDISAMAS